MANERRTQAGGARRASYSPPSPSQARAPRKRVVLTGPPPLSKAAMRISAVALLVATGLAVGGLFPKYTLDAAPSSGSTASVLLHVVASGAWLIGAIAILSGRAAVLRMGNALAAGASLVTIGISIVEVSQLIGTGESLGAGFWMETASVLVALLAALIGTLTLRRSTTAGGLGRLRLWSLVPAGLVGILVVVAYTQSWQHERITSGTAHKSEGLDVPGQFDARWEVIAGQILILVTLVALPVLASQWGRRRAGGAFMVGAAVGFAGFALPTYVTTEHPLSRFSAAVLKELKQEKLSFTMHLLWWYWAVAAGALALAVIGIVLLAVRDERPQLNLGQ